MCMRTRAIDKLLIPPAINHIGKTVSQGTNKEISGAKVALFSCRRIANAAVDPTANLPNDE